MGEHSQVGGGDRHYVDRTGGQGVGEGGPRDSCSLACQHHPWTVPIHLPNHGPAGEPLMWMTRDHMIIIVLRNISCLIIDGDRLFVLGHNTRAQTQFYLFPHRREIDAARF